MSSSLKRPQSESELQCSSVEVTNSDDDPLRSLSRVRIELVVDPDAGSSTRKAVTRLAERYMSGVPRFVILEDGILVLRLRHSDIRAVQTDQLTCRLARLKGVHRISAEQRRTGEGVVYAAQIRGRHGPA